ncbi:RagB/SusD family nutrient uptake outer membrane protein [Pontibacter sp. SGAir0037]|uniref:RagB/SusD family nutrient uptake outer membrane protein n=1 Tax=Pontibacter sp. SGAir0037 TaxID=2571030 RepID=UPI0010CD34D1|nr:RagB/SusD family nutrient uptake outer membrane protein [Pontibacter sp. SGAir0037]QCR21168.1 RagB/SusD family nutrient uptake outer membrane protein [Pontibacter sp. SGAir0037]
MKKYTYLIAALLLTCTACEDDEFLNREPRNILSEEQVFTTESLALAVVVDLYARYPDYQAIGGDANQHADFNEAFASRDYGRHGNSEFGYGDWGWWDYGFIRDLNLTLEKLEAASQLTAPARERFIAEVRWLRAAVYFNAVKRVGGVPLILESMNYDFSGDPTYLQRPRAKEHEIYDFVIQEMDAVKSVLPGDAKVKDRATKGLAMALKSRAALYAASIAKYGAIRTPQVTLPGGEVGIPASMANTYYTTALQAAQEIINGNVGAYALYLNNQTDLSANFASLFRDKNNNPEAIFVNDYKLKSGKINNWTLENQPRSLSEEGTTGGRLNASLNLVQSFELIEGNTFAPLRNRDASGKYIEYENQLDIFAGRDARLYATVMLPGSVYRPGGSTTVDIWRGLYRPGTGTMVTSGRPGDMADLVPDPDNVPETQVVGFDGPVNGFDGTAQTGFYIRKYMDPTVGAGQIGTQSDTWYIRYRYGEVLLNAAEAAFELGNSTLAAEYINQVRRRAGFTTDLASSEITFDRIVHERRVELAYEGHELWDMKRWRLAHIVLNGQIMDVNSLTQNIGKADKTRTQVFGLWPYKIYNPGGANNGHWVFDIVRPDRVTGTDWFRIGNYYSFINDDIRNRNPSIVRNPNQ